MSATNHTTNYELPIFVGTDKPAWLVDWNEAMTAIDTAIHTAEGKADQAGTDIGGIESSISTINSTLTSINNAVSQLRIDTNANTGSINTITSLIGNGEPTTTDKTLIGAINELHGDIENIDVKVYDFDIKAKTVSEALYTGLTKTGGAMKALINNDSSVGKVYGYISAYSESGAITIPANGAVVTLTVADLDVSESFDVEGFEVFGFTTAADYISAQAYLHFNTNGTVELRIRGQMNKQYYQFNLPPCLLFLKDLGD